MTQKQYASLRRGALAYVCQYVCGHVLMITLQLCKCDKWKLRSKLGVVSNVGMDKRLRLY